MGRVKCNYCGSYIDDSLTNCPQCGAVNEHMIRFADKTPKTIEELKEWYRERNLPPEETTRFFIGKDISSPRAFGIYEKDGKYTVYKNKSDGTRAIRYEGRDEAYAVNEIYMKLKEEILNQKNRNLTRTSGSRAGTSSYQKYSKNKILGLLFSKVGRTVIIFIIISLLSVVFAEKPLKTGYYTKGLDDAVYYYDAGNSEWWVYNTALSDWSYYSYSSLTPVGIEKSDRVQYSLLPAEFQAKAFECPGSRVYIDRHHPAIRQGYYVSDDSLYYYLDNRYGTNSGWYSYDDGGWEYWCDSYDKDTLGEGLWYSTDDYFTASEYSALDSDAVYEFSDSEEWNADFSDTSFYETYKEDLSEYNSSRSSSNDSSWDWDSGSSWDSGWSDWDSDW